MGARAGLGCGTLSYAHTKLRALRATVACPATGEHPEWAGETSSFSRMSSSSSLAMLLYCREEEGGGEGENQQTNSLRSECRAWRGGGGARQTRSDKVTSSSVMSRAIAMARSPSARRTGEAYPWPARSTKLLLCHGTRRGAVPSAPPLPLARTTVPAQLEARGNRAVHMPRLQAGAPRVAATIKRRMFALLEPVKLSGLEIFIS
jgi:hypothetical protein